MYKFHKERDWYFDMQYKTCRDYIIPFMDDFIPHENKLHVLEIGCGEAGVLKAFTERGDKCVGIELSESKLNLAREFMQPELENNQVSFLNEDIHDVTPETQFAELFDVIILKDVIEHIHNRDQFIEQLKKFLKPDGVVFFGFPPWYMPFGGHQQMAVSKWASKLPYYHILPKPIYRWILKIAGESDAKIAGLMDTRETGISIERFEHLTQNSGWKIVRKKYWLANPIYQWKFGIQPHVVIPPFSKIPFFRNFWTTAMYYVIKQDK